MNKLLIICGPTATGKTRLALSLANRFNGELISVDSRQIYKYMDIVTGKDRPTDKRTKIWGYDLLLPDKQTNASRYANWARKKIADIWSRGKLPIVVGGAGFYINALLGKYQYLDIPRDSSLRKKLSKLNADKLYELLLNSDPVRAKALNSSDRRNKRRLIRALEVAEYVNLHQVKKTKRFAADVLWIGLKIDKTDLQRQISNRVFKRLGAQMDQEIKYLDRKGYLHAIPAQTLGYSQWIKYLEGEMTREEAIKEWIKQEIKYAKRQMTWFNKQKQIIWFKADSKDLQKHVEAKIQKWYA